MPTAAKSGNSLIVKNLLPGTYVVANAANPKQSKTYTVVKGCLVSDRTTIGSPSTLLISRQGPGQTHLKLTKLNGQKNIFVYVTYK